ncbi:MAG: helix-hairpin-helix domain-containing protein [Fodinibius sp.]|nr:helix-hairpin-helix domain-containing protein [Fodinibius sp.]
MKRQVFFWLERLKITPAERKTVSGLMIVLVLLGGTNLALSPSVPFEDSNYRELEKQFNKRTADLKAEEDELLEQYFPPPKKQQVVAVVDTTEDDSTSSNTSSKSDQEAGKQQININKASADKLERLPGIGPTYARRIVAYRQKNGSFESIVELKKIDGIAQKRLDKFEAICQTYGFKINYIESLWLPAFCGLMMRSISLSPILFF